MISLSEYIVELLAPYTAMPDFTLSVMKAMQKLGYTVTAEDPKSALAGKEACCIIIDEVGAIANQKWIALDPAKFEAYGVDCGS